MAGQPRKLKKDPILEAVFELRFSPKNEGVGDLLPGLVFEKRRQHFPKLERLPTASLPREFAQIDAGLRYASRYRLVGDSYAILLGENMVALSCLHPYVGWENFQPEILKLIADIKQLDVIQSVTRYSLKYINSLEGTTIGEKLSLLNFRSELGRIDLTKCETNIRTEFRDSGYLNLIELQTSVAGKTLKGKTFEGALLSIDTIVDSPDSFWDQPASKLDAAHNMEKSIFFAMLSAEALRAYEAEY